MRKKRAGLAALGEWRHINCLRSSAMDNIQDDVLRKVAIIHEPKAEEDFSPPATQLDRLLFAVDPENIKARDDDWTVHEVPGGSVSFIFQKSLSVPKLPSCATDEEG